MMDARSPVVGSAVFTPSHDERRPGGKGDSTKSIFIIRRVIDRDR